MNLATRRLVITAKPAAGGSAPSTPRMRSGTTALPKAATKAAKADRVSTDGSQGGCFRDMSNRSAWDARGVYQPPSLEKPDEAPRACVVGFDRRSFFVCPAKLSGADSGVGPASPQNLHQKP